MHTGAFEVSAAIESYMTQEWVETPLAYDNVQFDDEVPEFVKLTVLWTGARQASMGGLQNVHRFYGMAVAQVYISVNTGTRRADLLADIIVRLFAAKQFQGITFLTPEALVIGDDGHGKYQVNVNCPFFYDGLI